MRVIIIGAGPTGLGAANRLHESGHEDWMLYERCPYFGGLATSFIDAAGFTWDFAVHVAHSHYHYVDELMERLLPDGFYHHQRMSWVREYGTFIPYPFQNNIRHLPGDALWECVEGLLALQDQNGSQSPENFEQWILQGFGEGIAKHFMLPYNRKIWRVDPSEMGYQWIGDRVPTIDLKRILRNISLEQDDVGWGPNATFQIPKEGGTGAIWKRLGESLPAENIRLECGIAAIDAKNKTVTLDDGSVDHYDQLISTIPLKHLTALTGIQKKEAAKLVHTRVTVAGIAPNQPIPEALTDKTWLYCPEEACCFYRVTPFSIFSPAHVPDPDKQCSFLCEISTLPDEELPQGDLPTRVMDDLRTIGLIDCDPADTHVHMMDAPYGYPVPTKDRDKILDRVLPALEAEHIYSRGRFGGWKYEVANMDHSLMQGVECVNRILHGEEEVTLPTPHIVNAGKR